MACSTQDSPVERGFNEDEIATYNSSDRFNYDRVIVTKQNVVLEFFIKVLVFIGEFLNSVLGIVLVILLIILLIYLVLINVQRDRRTTLDDQVVFKKISETQVEQIDFEVLIKNAIAKGDYRMAVRFRFLHLLKHLSKNNLINI